MSTTCSRCNAQLPAPPPGGLCPSCRQPWLPLPVLPAEAIDASSARWSRLAIASFLFAFLICLPILNAGLALGLGIGALASINGSHGALKGRGLAIAGIVCGCFSIILALPVSVMIIGGLSQFMSRTRTAEIRGQVEELGKLEYTYFQAHGQFLRVPPVPLMVPSGEAHLEANDAMQVLGWRPPASSHYRFQVEVEDSGAESKARVTADRAGPPGPPPVHEEVVVTPTAIGIATDVNSHPG